MECDIAGGHVNSFNYLCDGGLDKAARDIIPERFKINAESVEIAFESAILGNPVSTSGALSSRTSDSEPGAVYPAECRQRNVTYKGPLRVTFGVKVDGRELPPIEKVLGEIPVMLRSKKCNLYNLSREELIKHGEEPIEHGGYYIVNGTEKVIRYLVLLRRNFPLAMKKERFRTRGKLFSEFGITMRNVRANHSASTMTLHYLETGSMTLLLRFNREMFYIPFIYVLKGLTDGCDRDIFDALMRGRQKDSFWRTCVMSMLRNATDNHIVSQEAALKVLGKSFTVVMGQAVAPWDSNEDVGRFLLKTTVAIHLDDPEEKFNLLVFMAQKLMSLVQGECQPESPDNPQFYEVTTSGHLILQLVKERMENSLNVIRKVINAHASRQGAEYVVSYDNVVKVINNLSPTELTRAIEYFLATGNLISKSGMALQQTSGFTVIAERINQLRYLTHYRAIHRGAFFMEMRTTDVRKLRPEAWGFICPVHTPDGGPCGLLNHLSAACEIVCKDAKPKPIIRLLMENGLVSLKTVSLFPKISNETHYPVLINGRFVGYVDELAAKECVNALRMAKVVDRISRHTEVALISRPTVSGAISQYPGLYIFSDAARLMRPVRNMVANKTEYIGTFEQVYLSVCLDASLELEWGITMHQELKPNSLFSFAANLIPYPDHNQSPRNVYQCQMGKQTMGTAIHSWHARADNKMYRLQTPQSPIVVPEAYDTYEMDEYPSGTNAIVAVISYTGYDMEDAMVINKGSYERGFAHGQLYKCQRLFLNDPRDNKARFKHEIFRRDPTKPILEEKMDANGLPIIGKRYSDAEYYYCTYDIDKNSYHAKKVKSAEDMIVESVRLIDSGSSDGFTHALIQWRILRNPIIGDKFASRHGQKGINSFLWPVEDLPFTESGMYPDIIFNPHGYPSRMTIGMMIESMAGKSAALHGWRQDATPFVFNEKDTGIDYMGKLLTRAGYNYYGQETLYSGIDGREFQVEIFIGLVYYQRLRHMIADKYQVRSTGAMDSVTHQPVKGRKRGGGVRLGEMERDALISHGTTAIIQDRLCNCSDGDVAEMCSNCGSLLSLKASRVTTSGYGNNNPAAGSSAVETTTISSSSQERSSSNSSTCRLCKNASSIVSVTVPYVFRYLVNELASMNIQTKLSVKRS